VQAAYAGDVFAANTNVIAMNGNIANVRPEEAIARRRTIVIVK
jgi:hypothetical protein